MAPTATRSRAVVKLDFTSPLFITTNPEQIDFEAAPTCYIKCVSAALIPNSISSNLQELIVDFWARKDSVGHEKAALSILVLIPYDWNARVYLGALNISIKKNKIISLERMWTTTTGSRDQYKVNEVHWLFDLSCSEAHQSLITKADFFAVYGGERNP